VIVAVVVPALDAQLLQEVLDHALPQNWMSSLVQRFDVCDVTSSICHMTSCKSHNQANGSASRDV
jgi:hypothetical protein